MNRKHFWQSVVIMTVLSVLATGCIRGGNPKPVIQGVKRYASVAENADEFAAVFGKRPTMAQLDEVTRAAAAGRKAGFTLLRSGADQFLSDYRATSADELVVLVGHQSDGQFRLHDGSALNLSQLGSEDHAAVALFSCESARFASGNAVGIPTKITFDVAYLAEEKFVARVTQLEKRPGQADLAELLVQSVDEAANDLHAVGIRRKVLAVGGPGGAAAGYVLYQQLEG